MIDFFLSVLKICIKDRSIKIGLGTLINHQTSFEGHNRLGKFVSFKNSYIGFCSYIGDGCHLSSVKIGRYCSIASNVMGITGTHPVNEVISSHPAFYAPKNMVDFSYVDVQSFTEHNPAEPGYSITIGNDVWIGAEVKILEGIHINDGAIIACGAVVTEDVPAYAVVGGVPARVIKYRYSKDEIVELLSLKWWDWEIEEIAKLKNAFNDVPLFIRLAKELINRNTERK